MAEPIKPVLPEDVQTGKAGPAPPSYEEVMGQYMTSVGHQQTEMPALAYIDIMPRVLTTGYLKANIAPTFQPFTDIINGANVWLRDNPGLSVWKCETVERKVMPGANPGEIMVEMESMCHHESCFGFNCFVFGLRMWLTPKPPDQKGVQELGLVNMTPTAKEIEVDVFYGGHGRRRRGFGGGFGIGGYMTMRQQRTFITYVGLKKSIEDYNAKVESNPIPGTLINIESTILKFGGEIDSMTNVAEQSSWYESGNKTIKRFTQVLRLFYVKGSQTKPKIDMAEFLPTQLNNPNWNQKVKFADFDDALGRAGEWIRSQSGIKIMNIETRDARLTSFFNQNFEIDSDSTDDIQFQAMDITKIRFLRIFYIKDTSSPSFAHTIMSSRLFVPILIKGNTFETMTETMRRIDAWMKLVGLPIFGVETVSYLKTLGPKGIDDVRSDYSLKTFSGKHWVTAIRVYFPAAFEEPPPELLPPVNLPGNAKSSKCVIL